MEIHFDLAEGISPTEISEDTRPLAKGAIASAVIRSREPFILADLSTHTYWPSVNAMKAAGLNSTVYVAIIGETGTGKDMIAQYIHQVSNRNNALFVKVNCPTLNSALFES